MTLPEIQEQVATQPFLEGASFDVVKVVFMRLAHDLNNLSVPLIAYPELLRRDCGDGGHGRDLLDGIQTAGRAITHTAHHMNMLADVSAPQGARLSLLDLVEQARLALAQGAAPATTAALQTLDATGLSPDLSIGPVAGERVAFAVKALLANAVEAVAAQGAAARIVVTGAAGPAPAWLGRPGVFTRLTVADNGRGIAAALNDTLFVPFVTTRQGAGKRGAGLGLPLVYRIMHEHGGRLSYGSLPGRGCRFSLWFPRGAEARAGEVT